MPRKKASVEVPVNPEEITRLTRSEVLEAGAVNREQAMAMVSLYYSIQKLRIGAESKIGAHERRADLLADLGMVKRLRKNFEILENQTERGLKAYAQSQKLGRWAMSNYGVGPVIAAGMLAHIDITKAKYAGCIYNFAGLNPTQVWAKGEKRPYNAKLKTLCYKLGQSFKFVSNYPDAFYGKIYKQRKAYEVQKNERGEYADQVKQRMADSLKARRPLTEAQQAYWPLGKYHPYALDMRACRFAVKFYLCFSSDTKLWTKEGPKNIKRITKDDLLATLNPDTGKLEWQHPTQIHSYPYDGKLVNIKGVAFDFLVTHNHRMWVKRGINSHKGKWEFRTAGELFSEYGYEQEQYKMVMALSARGETRAFTASRVGVSAGAVQGWAKGGKKPWPCSANNYRIKLNADWEGVDQNKLFGYPSEKYLEFLGWFLSEGHTYKSPDHAGSYTTGISNNDRGSLERARQLAAHMGYSNGAVYTKYGTPQMTISSKELYQHLSPLGKSYNKFIWPEVKELPTSKLKILIGSMLEGDGTRHPGGDFSKYCTTSKRLAYDFAEIALKCGYGIGIRKRPRSLEKYKDLWVVNLRNEKVNPQIMIRPNEVDYEGTVHCVTVPNHLVFAGRHGKYGWCGNSHYHSVGCEILGLEVPKPYILFADPTTHTHYVPAPLWPMEEAA